LKSKNLHFRFSLKSFPIFPSEQISPYSVGS
jgi:hypothetical protein